MTQLMCRLAVTAKWSKVVGHMGGVLLAQLLFIVSANVGIASLMILAVACYIFITHVCS